MHLFQFILFFNLNSALRAFGSSVLDLSKRSKAQGPFCVAVRRFGGLSNLNSRITRSHTDNEPIAAAGQDLHCQGTTAYY